MGEKKFVDLALATKDEVVDYSLAEILPSIIQTYGDLILSEGLAQLLGELVGAVCPRLNSIRLSYKQNRLERNFKTLLQLLVAKDELLTARISALEATIEGQTFIHQTSELMLDGIVDEIQPEKVKYNVNGFINLIQTEDANMDMALMFFKTLYELNDIDIRVLKAYNSIFTMAQSAELDQECRLDDQQMGFVKEKLCRLGLLKSENEKKTKQNLEMMIEYLKKADKDSRSSRPKGVKLPNFKRTFSSDSYSITVLGRTLLQLISEQCDLSSIGTDEDVEEVDNA